MNSRALVREILETSGMTKAKLSRVSGVSRSALDAYLAGGSSPTVRQLDTLARAAGCEIVADVQRKAPAQPVPEALSAVLEFGELFPEKTSKPLPDLGPMWRAARARGSAG